MKKLKESDIQRSIIDYLERKGFLVHKVNNVGIYVKKRDCYIPPKEKGVSDLLFWKAAKTLSPGKYQDHAVVMEPARYGAIEVKLKPKEPTPEQLAWGEQMKHAGGVFIVAYSVDDVVEVMG